MRVLPPFVGIAGILFAIGTADAQAQRGQGDAAVGRAFALQVCTPCHVVSRHQLSPPRFAVGPAFDAIANDATTTPSGLHAFLSTPHPTMPNLILTRLEQRNIIAYIMSLKR
jgi:mono/diheme cytochrome c family protein